MEAESEGLDSNKNLNQIISNEKQPRIIKRKKITPEKYRNRSKSDSISDIDSQNNSK